jgi:hypothetical protein
MRGCLFFHHQKRILVFPRGRSIERKIRYQSYRRRPVRHVVKAGGRKIDGSGPANYRHAAFAARFVELRGQWYLAIEPTYHFTTDGHEEYPFESERLAGIDPRLTGAERRRYFTTPYDSKAVAGYVARLRLAEKLVFTRGYRRGRHRAQAGNSHQAARHPGTAAWAIGLLVGINMVFGGSALIAMALHAREIDPRSAAPAR